MNPWQKNTYTCIKNRKTNVNIGFSVKFLFGNVRFFPSNLQQIDMYNFPDGGYQMKREHVEDVVRLLADGFLEKNELWKLGELDFEQLRLFFTKEVQIHLDSQDKLRKEMNNPNIILNRIRIVNQEIVGVLMHLEIDEYRKITANQKESEVRLWRELEREGKVLAKVIDISSLEKGKYVYGTWGANKTHGPTPMSKLFVGTLNYEHMRLQGFKGIVFRSTNDRIVRMAESMGSEILRELPFSQGGKDFRIWLLRNDFDNPMHHQLVEEATKAMSQRILPKL